MLEGLPKGVVELVSYGLPRKGEKYINDTGEIAEAPYDFKNAKRLIVRTNSYAEGQAAWVKEHGVKAGDKVRVLRMFSEGEGGFSCHANPQLNDYVGKVGVVRNVLEEQSIFMEEQSIFIDHHDAFWSWPYFCLEKVIPATRPMTRDEFLAAWKQRNFCPLIDSEDDIDIVNQVTESDPEYDDETVSTYKHGWVSLETLSAFKFASDETYLTIEE